MAELASKVQETINLAVLSQTKIVYIDKADSPRTLGVISKMLPEELEKSRKRGYAFDQREYEEGVECIEALIRDHLGEVIAALSISCSQRKIGIPQEKDFVNQVVESARLISLKMGYRRSAT